jgi:SanA protein
MAGNPRRTIFFWTIKLPFLLFAAAVVVCNLWIILSTRDRVFKSIDAVEPNQIGIVLGTSKKIAAGRPNQHFENRLAAAAELYHAGKVKHLLVSGSRDSQYYDEPRDMHQKLQELGVPSAAITEDECGLRTLDSIVRAKRVYGLSEVTVISDDFHVGRALFIADREGLDAIAFRGDSVSLRFSMKARVREYFARVKAVLDLYLLDTEPALVGEPVEILVQGGS